MLNNVRVWGAWWPSKVFKLRRVFLEPLCSNSGRVWCRFVLLELAKSVGMHNRHEWMQVIRQDAYVRVTCQSHLDVPGVAYHSTAHVLHHSRASTRMNRPLLTCRVHGFMRLSLYPYTSIRSIQFDTRLVRPGNMFSVINSSMWVLTSPGAQS